MRNTQVTNLPSQLIPAGTGALGEELAVSNAVVVSVTAWGDNISHFEISVKAQAVHVTFDGSDPADGASAAGLYLPASAAPITWTKARLLAARFIRAAGSDAVVRIEPMSVE